MEFLLSLILMQAVGPVVGNASFLAWDYAHGIEDEFRVYCGADPGVVPSEIPVAKVPSSSLQWPISGLSGQQHCVVTAFDAGADVESGPSNEVAFFVLAAPGGARIVVSPGSEN